MNVGEVELHPKRKRIPIAERFDLVYGPTGSGKTTWLLQLARHIFENTGKKTRWYVGDQSLEMIDNEGVIDDGVVEAWVYATRPNPLSVAQMMTEGAWPTDPLDPKSPLVKPTKPLREDYGMVVFEGLSVLATYIMGSVEGGLAHRAARGEKMGQDPPFVISDKVGNTTIQFGGNSMAHYGFAQARIIDAILRSKALDVPVVYWTAHERTSEDREAKETIVGPDAAGKAMTSKIPLWFGNTIHLTTAQKRVKSKDVTSGRDVDHFVMERRAYTMDHCDPDGLTSIKFIANNRCPLLKNDKGIPVNPMPEYIAPPDPLRFYSIMAEARQKKREASAHGLQTPAKS